MATYTLKLVSIQETGSIGRQLKATVTTPGGSISFGFQGTSSKHHIIAQNVPIGGDVQTIAKKISLAKSTKSKSRRGPVLTDSNSVVVPIIVNALESDKKQSDLPYNGFTNMVIDMNSPINTPFFGKVTFPIAEVGGRGKNKGRTARLTFNFEAKVESEFSVRDIPGIMTAKGWTNGAAFQNKWFAAPAAVSPDSVQSPDINTIKMSWVLSFPRAKTVYDDLVENKITNKAAINAIKNKYRNIIGHFGDFSVPVKILHPQSIQHEPVRIPGTVDDMFCALGNFSIYIVVKGVASNTEIQVTHIGLFVYDSFDFNGFQPLGFWNKNPSYGGFNPNKGFYVSNASFRDYRKQTGIGGDFFVFSDLVVIKLAKPIIIT